MKSHKTGVKLEAKKSAIKAIRRKKECNKSMTDLEFETIAVNC